MAEHDARRAYLVWLRLIADEELYRTLLAGRHRELSRGLEPEDLAILDDFAARPGTRWNMENLRFRAALETATKLKIWMPRTIRLLTTGNDDWLQELCYEYLAYHRWQECGHFHFAEVERFAAYVRERVMKRRSTSAWLEPVLSFECAVAELLKSTQGLAPESWPARPFPSQGRIGELCPRRGPATSVLELPVDITDWIRSGDPALGEPREQPTTLLLFVPSLREKHRIQVLGAGSRAVFSRCTGERSVREVAEDLEAELGLAAEETVMLISRWLEQGALVLEGPAASRSGPLPEGAEPQL
jgi:hypothetical protein